MHLAGLFFIGFSLNFIEKSNLNPVKVKGIVQIKKKEVRNKDYWKIENECIKNCNSQTSVFMVIWYVRGERDEDSFLLCKWILRF